jgi:quinol monooxygenase YgiN
MINVMVTMIIKEGRMNDFLAECAKIRPGVLKEEGCHGYEYTREIASPVGIQEPVDSNRITLLERWESIAAIEAHSASPHMKEFGPRVKDLRASVTARVTEPIF